MKFLEVHKRGIDFFNGYGLNLNKKGSKEANNEPVINTHESETPYAKELQSKQFYNKYFRGT